MMNEREKVCMNEMNVFTLKDEERRYVIGPTKTMVVVVDLVVVYRSKIVI